MNPRRLFADWRRTGGGLNCSPAVANGMVRVGSVDVNLFAFG